MKARNRALLVSERGEHRCLISIDVDATAAGDVHGLIDSEERLCVYVSTKYNANLLEFRVKVFQQEV